MRLPLFLMALGIAMGLIYLTLFVVSLFIYLGLHTYPTVSWLMMSTLYALTLPTFVLGVALFLMWMIEVKSDTASNSRVIFLCGALILFIGSLLTIINNWLIWGSSHDSAIIVNEIYLEAAPLAFLLGIVICAIATLFLCKSYLRGEVRIGP